MLYFEDDVLEIYVYPNHGSNSDFGFDQSDYIVYKLLGPKSVENPACPLLIDINKDGRLDIFVLEVRKNPQNDSVEVKIYPFINDGIGGKVSFTYAGEGRYGLNEEVNKFKFDPIGGIVKVSSGDIDNDGDDDVIIPLSRKSPSVNEALYLIKNTSVGTDYSFTAGQRLIPYQERQLSVLVNGVFVDIDSDGDEDILYAGSRYDISMKKSISFSGYLENLLITSTEEVLLNQAEF